MFRNGARLLSALALAALVVPAGGCLGGLLNPIGPEAREREGRTCPLPQGCRNHVYVFLIHGADPLDFANLSGVRDHLTREGYIKTCYGQMYHTPWFVHEVRRIHKE